jgi:hypothetical protein
MNFLPGAPIAALAASPDSMSARMVAGKRGIRDLHGVNIGGYTNGYCCIVQPHPSALMYVVHQGWSETDG